MGLPKAHVRVVFTRSYLKACQHRRSHRRARSSRCRTHRQPNHSRTKQALAANPFIGRPGEIKGTREFVLAGTSYIVAYRVTDNQVEVLFVQHGAREWPDDA
jgi:hypothetical protein